MRLGVISDTHGHVGRAAAGIEMLSRQGVEAIVHCGDIGSPGVVSLFAGTPTWFVFGNVDGDEVSLRAAIRDQEGLTCGGLFADLTLGGRRIAVLHSHEDRRLAETISLQEYDLVCYGHTHRAEQHREGGTLVLNPGAMYRAKVPTVAVVDLDSMAAQILPVATA